MKRFDFIKEENENSESRSSKTTNKLHKSSNLNQKKGSIGSNTTPMETDSDDLDGIKSLMSGLNTSVKERYNSQRASINQSGRSR